jgi:ribosomal-protein-serine acetyltransferase
VLQHSRITHPSQGFSDPQANPQLELSVDQSLHLRTLAPSDAEALFTLTDQNRLYLQQWLPWLNSVLVVDDTLAFIQLAQSHAQDGKSYTFGIWEFDRLVGVVGHHLIDPVNRSTQLGYWLGQPFQGRGIMTRACRRLITFSFQDLYLQRIEIRCAPLNTPSRRIPERLGFRHEGTLRSAEWLYDHFVDLQIYGMLNQEWMP